MRYRQAKELRVDLSRYGDDATYLILEDGRVLLFTAEDEHRIRAKIIDTNGDERDEPAPSATRELRQWIEEHRER